MPSHTQIQTQAYLTQRKPDQAWINYQTFGSHSLEPSTTRAPSTSTIASSTAMRSTYFFTLLPFLLSTVIATESESTKPCTINSPLGAYFDLNTITVQPRIDHKKAHKDDRTESWHAKGYDYNVNFTLNFCAPVIETLEDVVGVESSLYKNISAFYEFDGKTYSIGYVLGLKPQLIL